MNKLFAWSGVLILCAASGAWAADHTGMLGLNYTVGPNFIIGGSEARDSGSVEPGVGAALQYGVIPKVDFVFAYDYVDADRRTQAITFNGQYNLPARRALTPFVGAGMGFGKPASGEGWGHFALKLTGGLEEALTTDISLAGVVGYQYVEGPDPVGSVHAFEPGVRLIYYFGGAKR